jgi:hypothetical protein
LHNLSQRTEVFRRDILDSQRPASSRPAKLLTVLPPIAAKALIDFLADPKAAAVYKAKGLQPG